MIRDCGCGFMQRTLLRRFLLHLLPRAFVRIRNFGFFANRQRAMLLPLCFRLLQDAAEIEFQPFANCPARGVSDQG